jgi:CHRD domain
MRKRTGLILAVAFVGAFALTALVSYGVAGPPKGNLKSKRMSGYLEVPSVSTSGRGTIETRIRDGSKIDYKLTYSGLTGNPSQAHIHFAQPSVNGGVVAFLCGGGGKPACPASTSGTVSGTIVAADIQAVASQGIAAGEFAEVAAAMKAGFTYANIHTASFPGGELRGQISPGGDGGDDD